MFSSIMLKRGSRITLIAAALLFSVVLFATTGCLRSVNDDGKVNSDLVQWGNANDEEDSVGLEDSEVALGLLTAEDMTGINVLSNIRPMTIELNDHLDGDYLEDYMFFVSRGWYDRATGSQIFHNAITKYRLPAVAAEQIVVLAGDEQTVTELAQPIGDTQVVYFLPADDTQLATLVYRFTVGQYGVKVQVSDVTGAADMTAVQTDLLAQAEQIAEYQYEKVYSLIYSVGVEPAINDAIAHLPESISGTTFIGTSLMTDQEWLGLTYDLESENIAGFVNGGIARYQIDARPDEVVEVSVMEFGTAEEAEAFRDGLLVAGAAAESGTEIALPASLDEVADAIQQDTLVELQAAMGYYLIDISIFAPFAETDGTAAEADLITMSEEIIGNFQP